MSERSFSHNWYTRYHLIEYSPSWDAAFCYYCRLFASHKTGSCESAFIHQRYKNWKMASTDFKKHAESKVHRMAATQYVERNVCKKWVIQFHSNYHVHTLVKFRSIDEMSDVYLN